MNKQSGVILLGYIECECGNRAPAEFVPDQTFGSLRLIPVYDQLPPGWLVRRRSGNEFYRCPNHQTE